jgi:hypothetical protein
LRFWAGSGSAKNECGSETLPPQQPPIQQPRNRATNHAKEKARNRATQPNKQPARTATTQQGNHPTVQPSNRIDKHMFTGRTIGRRGQLTS